MSAAATGAPANVFMGTSAFAVTVLEQLADSAHAPELVITPPDRRRGRGRKLAPPPAAEGARELGLELHQTPSVNEPASIERIEATGAEVGVVCAFGQLIREPLLGELPMLNVHPSLLPRWRGAAPIERTIMAGDERTGVCIIELTAGLDSGPVALRRATPLGDGEDFGELSARLATLGGELALEALELRAAGRLEPAEQGEEGVSYAEKIEAADRTLDLGRSAVELARVVRALHPHIGARLRVNDAEALSIGAADVRPEGPDAGEVAADADHLIVGCGEGALAISELQSPGKRMLRAAEWMRGNPVPERLPLP